MCVCVCACVCACACVCCQPAGIIRCLDRKEHCFKSQSYALRYKIEWHPFCVSVSVCVCVSHYVINKTSLFHWDSVAVTTSGPVGVCVCVCLFVCVLLLCFKTNVITVAEPGRSYTQTHKHPDSQADDRQIIWMRIRKTHTHTHPHTHSWRNGDSLNRGFYLTPINWWIIKCYISLASYHIMQI